jgi:hypothetical protein
MHEQQIIIFGKLKKPQILFREKFTFFLF